MKKWIIMACLLAMPVLAYSQDRLAVLSDTTNCVNLYKPYRIVIPPGTDSTVTREFLEKYSNFIDLQFDEVYARVRDAICNLGVEILDSVGCVSFADTIHPCTVADYCIGDDPHDTNNAVVVVNSRVLELSWIGPEADCPLDTSYIVESILRWRGHNGDTLDLQFEGKGNSVSSPGPWYRRYMLPTSAINGRSVWVNRREVGTLTSQANTTGIDNDASLGGGEMEPNPYTGITQSGIITAVNTNMDRDTVIFATTFTNTHGGQDSTGGPVGTGTGMRSRGFRFDSATGYSISLNWGSGSSGFAGDSLWIQSTTDSSFVIGITYSATARTVHWQLHGNWKTNPY